MSWMMLVLVWGVRMGNIWIWVYTYMFLHERISCHYELGGWMSEGSMGGRNGLTFNGDYLCHEQTIKLSENYDFESCWKSGFSVFEYYFLAEYFICQNWWSRVLLILNDLMGIWCLREWRNRLEGCRGIRSFLCNGFESLLFYGLNEGNWSCGGMCCLLNTLLNGLWDLKGEWRIVESHWESSLTLMDMLGIHLRVWGSFIGRAKSILRNKKILFECWLEITLNWTNVLDQWIVYLKVLQNII